MNLTRAFQETLDQLNDEQRQAVEGIHGPWIVLAGPGTGKTHMLAARIGNILLREQVEPRNILCLTFTTAGVKAMRDRLVSFMGAAGSRVAVHTFHAFARRVIDENPHLFEYTDWQEMDELDARRLINEVIDGLPPRHELRGPGHEPYKFGKDLLWLFQQMAQESWTPDDVISAANHHVLDLPNIPEYVYQRKYKDKQPGDLKPKAAEQEARMERLKAGAALLDAYAALKRDRGLYDYGDQVSWLRDALRDHEVLRMQLQEQYQFILVDEYQDTNGLQNEIIALLADDENPNLFVVGDDDQSIFGFQGARIEGLRELTGRYLDDIRAVVLRENYRSHQAILDAAQHLITENKTRLLDIGGLTLDKTLREGGCFAERPMPEIVHYPNEWAQAHYVAELIQRWIDAGTDPNEIGVIYRKHSQAARLVDSLEERGVPYRLERSINVLDLPLIKRLHDVLAFIGNLRADRPVNNQQAFEFLQSPAIGLTTVELWELNNFRFTESRRVDAWRYLLSHPEVLERGEVPIGNPERFRTANALLNELGAMLDHYPLPTVIQQVAQRTGILREALAGDESELAIEALDAIVRDAHARISKYPKLTLSGLCATWDELIEYDMALRLVKQADTRAAVSLMTAHKAKGLEFERVVLYDVTKRAWDTASKGSRSFTLPPELSHELSTEAKAEENRRLFYVALTRAKREVHIAVPGESASGTPQSPSIAIDTLLTEHLATEREAEVNDEELHRGLVQHYGQALAPSAPLLSARAAQERWAEQDLSLSAATQFERCRVGFYYQYVSNVPRTKRPRDRFTDVVHETLREYYRRAQHPEEQQFASEEELVAMFLHQLNRQRAGLRAKEFEGFAAEGEETLRAWYQSEADTPALNTVIERNIALTTGMSLPLRGRVDRIDVDATSTLGYPVDYKLGAPRPIKYTVDKKTGRKRNLDDRTWRQLAFYAILMRDGFNKGAQPSRGKVVYLSPRGTEVVEVPLDVDDVKAFEDELYDTYHAIRACEDFAGCHTLPETSDHDKMKCSWCAYHYLERNDAVLVSEELVALDDE